MASATTQDVRYFDKTSGKTYSVVWVSDGTVLLESDDSVQILTTHLRLITRYEPIVTAYR